MAKGKRFSASEIIKIHELFGSGQSIRKIAKLIKRSERGVRNVIKKGTLYGSRKSSGRKRIMDKRDERQIFRLSTKDKMSCRSIAMNLSKVVSHETVWRNLQRNKNVKYEKMLRKPCLNKNHKIQRLSWAREVMCWNTEWKSIVFSDEKKFNLDGPDGYSYYWHDLRQEKEIRFSRQHGGGSVMFWGAFAYHGKSKLVQINKTLNSLTYHDILRENLINFGSEFHDPWKFQQDNAPAHASKSTKIWLQDNNIESIRWPARSPDMNPIENLWGILVKKVYGCNKQYLCMETLKIAILKAWDEISIEILHGLVNSMPDRIFNLIEKNGASTKY